MFEIQRYGKSELAMIYYPKSSCPKVAQNHLRVDIHRNKELLDRLRRIQPEKNLNEYSKAEVALIVEYLGEP